MGGRAVEYRTDEAAGKGSQIQSVLPKEKSRCFENVMPLLTVIVPVCNMCVSGACQRGEDVKVSEVEATSYPVYLGCLASEAGSIPFQGK